MVHNCTGHYKSEMRYSDITHVKNTNFKNTITNLSYHNFNQRKDLCIENTISQQFLTKPIFKILFLVSVSRICNNRGRVRIDSTSKSF